MLTIDPWKTKNDGQLTWDGFWVAIFRLPVRFDLSHVPEESRVRGHKSSYGLHFKARKKRVGLPSALRPSSTLWLHLQLAHNRCERFDETCFRAKVGNESPQP